MKPCEPTFTPLLPAEIAMYKKRGLSVTEDYTLNHSWCEFCGKPLIVAVKKNTVPASQSCTTCQEIHHGYDLSVPDDDIELKNHYANHHQKMRFWHETCRD